MRFAVLLLTCLSLHAQGYYTTNLYYGTIYKDRANGLTYTRWTNASPAVVVQTSTDLRTWTDSIVVCRLDACALQTFELPVSVTNQVGHAYQYLRLRSLTNSFVLQWHSCQTNRYTAPVAVESASPPPLPPLAPVTTSPFYVSPFFTPPLPGK